MVGNGRLVVVDDGKCDRTFLLCVHIYPELLIPILQDWILVQMNQSFKNALLSIPSL